MPPSTAPARGCPFITNVDGEDFVLDGITEYDGYGDECRGIKFAGVAYIYGRSIGQKRDFRYDLLCAVLIIFLFSTLSPKGTKKNSPHINPKQKN